MYDCTVILPTLNEEANIKRTIEKVFGEFYKYGINGQVLVVDDNSSDTTQEIVLQLRRFMYSHLNIIIRDRNPGLSASVVDGIREAKSEIVIVMDADGQHPVNKVHEIYDELKSGTDIVIGSRYIAGGGIENWTASRKFISQGATVLARVLFPTITDPVSGFFGLHKKVVDGVALEPKGYKILLEILGKGNYKAVKEVPYIFMDRHGGKSKLKLQTIVDYASQVFNLTPVFKFMLVGLSGVLVNLGILYALTEFMGLWYVWSSMIAIETSIMTNYILNDSWTFKHQQDKSKFVSRLIMFQGISMAGVLINLGVLTALTELAGMWYVWSAAIGIIMAFVWNYSMNRNVTWRD